MTKIIRRHTSVDLPQGNYEQELADLYAKTVAAAESEQTSSTRRVGTKSQAAAFARQYDELLAKAEADSVSVPLWAISNTQWSELADEHQPRDDDQRDKIHGVNMKTFPPALLLASLVEPDPDGPALRVPDLLASGRIILDGLDLSRVHYIKLESAAWTVNVSDDALPKFSAVSLLQQAREPDSKPQPDSE